MDTQNALQLVFERNAFYKRLHYLMLGTFVLSLMVIGVLMAMLIYILRHPASPVYFATDNMSRLINVTPVDRPNMSMEEVVNWTLAAVQAAYSYDYVNFRSQLQEAQKYFTNYGWQNYMRALRDSNNLLALTARKQIAIAQVVAAPKLLTQGILSGAYAWKFQIPLLVTYWEPPYDDRSKIVNPLEVTVIVQRQPILQSDKGLGILQVITRFASTQTHQSQQLSVTPAG